MQTVQASNRRDGRRRSATKRQARWRLRQREHVSVYAVPMSDDIVEMLIDFGWLQPSESEDREQIGDAVRRLLADAARHHRKNP